MHSLTLQSLQSGLVIPAHPLALTSARKLDERRQRALSRYYIAAGAGGLALAVHTTQFQIRDPKIALFQPVLQLAKEELDHADAHREIPLLRIAGVCGQTPQAAAEASLIRDLHYHAALLSLSALAAASEDQLLSHCRTIADSIPLIGFYLQPAVGGRILPYSFWRRFAEIPNVLAIKIAPFNRYQTLDVIRAVADAGRPDIALYTGNDDNIVLDLLTPYRIELPGSGPVVRRIVGGLLGHWAVWTKRAVDLLAECHGAASSLAISQHLLTLGPQITDCNAAFFDAPNNFAGCIPGLLEVLRRQRLLENTLCLNPSESLSPGQSQEIDRVYTQYPHLNDDSFVAEHLDTFLRP